MGNDNEQSPSPCHQQTFSKNGLSDALLNTKVGKQKQMPAQNQQFGYLQKMITFKIVHFTTKKSENRYYLINLLAISRF